MTNRLPILQDRIRCIGGQSFAFIPHRFLRDGFFASLSHTERSLYLFYVLAGDRNGVSYYHYDSICSALEILVDTYLEARNGLIAKDLIAFDGTRTQVLSLPARPVLPTPKPLKTAEDFELHDPATVRYLTQRTFSDRPEAGSDS
jgi:hypothetical protein